MPESPEVEVARRALEENCVGKRIVKCTVDEDPKVIDGVSASDLQSALLGKTIVSALRKGKNLWLRLDFPPFPTFQFGMAGAIYIKGIETAKYKRSAVNITDEDWPSKYSKVFAQLDDGLEFSFTDKRRFAKVRLVHDPESVPPISELGPDALNEPMKVDEFAKALSQKKTPIKALLLDQSFISGIGNWIADEVLYQARIHPMEKVSDLSKENCETLLKCIKEVIEKAIAVGADSSQYPDEWIVRYRDQKPGKAFVEGRKIEFITAGGRTTAFVPELQKLSSSSKAASSKSRKSKSDADDEKEAQENSKSDKDKDSSRVAKRKSKKPEDDDATQKKSSSKKPAIKESVAVMKKKARK
ncbi:Formamidopyrimidine-DNA glycosylase [Rhynchospora pubera]|uniref:Formamidopyrimidine-DNA glycosylase n=1 Tax=Rhynchospora pubera TaxID=906938 RepID=A0AAV8D744_9POAL|nr:Formamidopyrimidine-DNA glycosylase [Rhynchospora pubera]